MIDEHLLLGTDGTKPLSVQTILSSQLADPQVATLRYADDGPPPALSRPSWTGEPFAPGWVVATPAPDDEQLYSHSLTWAVNDEEVIGGAIIGNIVEHLANDTRAAAYAHLPPAAARAARAADAVAAGAAREVHADLFVTDRAYLLASNRELVKGVAIVSVSAAVAMLGLFLRSRRTFHVWAAPGAQVRFNKGLWFWVGARELLPAGWRWMSACVAHRMATGDDVQMLHAQAVFQRVTRALQARDALWQALSSRQTNDISEDALIALDSLLLFLMGAADATARVAHACVSLPPGSAFNAGWQRSQWLKVLVAADPAFADLLTPGSANADAMSILSKLRNTVHGEGLLPLAVSKYGRRHDETLIQLPDRDSDTLLAAMDRHGGRAAWGVRATVSGQVHVDPGVLTERLFPMIVGFLDSAMATTPVENLLSAPLTDNDMHAPEGHKSPFRQPFRDSIRWQLGF